MVSCRTFLVVGCLLLVHAINGLPQRKSSESPVIFIDFDYQGKPGEKSLRSLDQVAYQDGVVNRARSNLRDSYGNPVEYDTLEAVDNDKPGKNHPDPNKFIIPGYASGILQPHEVPTRSNVDAESSRKIDDDRIHFVDPLQNAYQNTDKAALIPSPSLAAPPGPNFGNANNQPAPIPISIPRPNIDLPETPQTPIDDPLNHVLTPPQDNSASKPSFSLQAPGQNTQQNSFTQGLVPPQIPTEGQSVFIPRPNLDISETPIDNSNGPLNQGLLPPTDGTPIKKAEPTKSPFLNPSQNGNPVIITEVNFAPKPSNGLLPPKDVFPNDINFQSPDASTLPNVPSTVSTPSNTFGGAPGVLGQPGNNLQNKASAPGSVAPTQQSNNNKYSGSFGGAPGVLGQPGNTLENKLSGVGSNQPVQQLNNNNVPPPNKFSGSFGGSQGVLGSPSISLQTPNQIPVIVVQSPFPKPQQGPSPTQTFASQAPKPANNKYQGTFGGSPGVLISDSQSDRVVPTAGSQAQPTVGLPSIAPTFASPATPVLNNRFPGTFGGGQGVLGDNTVTSSYQPTPTQTLAQLPPLSNNFPVEPKENPIQKYTGQFGGAPGVLKPYDNQ